MGLCLWQCIADDVLTILTLLTIEKKCNDVDDCQTLLTIPTLSESERTPEHDGSTAPTHCTIARRPKFGQCQSSAPYYQAGSAGPTFCRCDGTMLRTSVIAGS